MGVKGTTLKTFRITLSSSLRICTSSSGLQESVKRKQVYDRKLSRYASWGCRNWIMTACLFWLRQTNYPMDWILLTLSTCPILFPSSYTFFQPSLYSFFWYCVDWKCHFWSIFRADSANFLHMAYLIIILINVPYQSSRCSIPLLPCSSF